MFKKIQPKKIKILKPILIIYYLSKMKLLMINKSLHKIYNNIKIKIDKNVIPVIMDYYQLKILINH